MEEEAEYWGFYAFATAWGTHSKRVVTAIPKPCPHTMTPRQIGPPNTIPFLPVNRSDP